MEWEVNNPGTDFVANITPGPVNINRSQYFRIIIDNTSGATKGSISGLQRVGVTKTVNWTNGSLPVVSGEDVYDIYEFYCFRGDGGSDETWYGTLLNERNYRRSDNGQTTKGWWTEGVYNSILAYTRSNLNEQLDQITSSRDIVAKTAKLKPSLVNASANRGR